MAVVSHLSLTFLAVDMLKNEAERRYQRQGIKHFRTAFDAWFKTWKKRYNISNDLGFRQKQTSLLSGREEFRQERQERVCTDNISIIVV